MKMSGVMFNGPMTRAILQGRKTVTRRARCDVHPGDVIWVRETWKPMSGESGPGILYAADSSFLPLVLKTEAAKRWEVESTKRPTWRASMQMPRWVCRLDLEVTDVRLGRLQKITDEQALEEGVIVRPGWTPREMFRELWIGLYGSESWDKNPELFEIKFKIQTSRKELGA